MLVSTSPRLAAWLQSASMLRICFSIAAGSTGGGTCATGCGGGEEHEMANAQTIKAIANRPRTKVFLIVPPRCARVVEQDANAANRSQAIATRSRGSSYDWSQPKDEFLSTRCWLPSCGYGLADAGLDIFRGEFWALRKFGRETRTPLKWVLEDEFSMVALLQLDGKAQALKPMLGCPLGFAN